MYCFRVTLLLKSTGLEFVRYLCVVSGDMWGLNEWQKFLFQSEVKIYFLKFYLNVNQIDFLLQSVILERWVHQPNSSCRVWNCSILRASLNMEPHFNFLLFPWALAAGSWNESFMLFSYAYIKTNASQPKVYYSMYSGCVQVD